MPREARKLLADILGAIECIRSFVVGRTFEEYLADRLLRSAVERQLLIVGEATRQLEIQAPELAERIPERREAIALRNILAHGYVEVEDELIWSTIQEDFLEFESHVRHLLESASS